jgi:hypothetical protein
MMAEQEQECRKEAERLAQLPAEVQRHAVALILAPADNPKVGKRDRQEARERADALCRERTGSMPTQLTPQIIAEVPRLLTKLLQEKALRPLPGQGWAPRNFVCRWRLVRLGSPRNHLAAANQRPGYSRIVKVPK